MTDAINRLLQEALALGPDERAALAAEILASLDESDGDVEHAWAAEIDRRSREAAETRGFPYHVVFEELADRVEVLAIAHDRRRPGYWR